MAHHSIGSIREMVRQYREELSCQTAHDKSRLRDKRPVSTVQKLCWHENGTPIHARTGTCTPLRFRMVDLAEFQDLDRRAAEVLRRSQPVISEGRKSPPAPVSKQRPHDNGHSVERRNHCRTSRDVVARNFEEIDKILGESNLIMEQSSSTDKVLSCTKSGVDTPRMLLELQQGMKKDVEAREVAAIKAANDYLNKSNGHSNILVENLPQICTEEVLITTCRRSIYSPDQACPSNTNKHEMTTTVSLPSSVGTKVPTALESKRVVPVPESERQWLLSEGKDVISSSKGTWKYEDSTQSLDFALATVETQQFPNRKPVKKPCKSRGMSGQEDPDLLVSESQSSCTGRGLRKEVSCLELNDMKQLWTDDLLMILENPRKVRASVKSKNRIWEGRGTCCPERYLSPGKTSTVGDFESCFAGDSSDEELAAKFVLQRSKVGHPDHATQLQLGSSAKCRGIKEKGNRSPAWMQSLNVRKPSKWRAMSTAHTRSAASLIKGTVAVEELEELALRCNQPEAGAAATVNNNNNFKTNILQEDVDNCKTSSHSPASNELPNEIISLPRVATIQGNPHVSIAQEDVESTFSSGLNSLISEVVHEWVEECSVSSSNLSVSPDNITSGEAANGELAIKQSLPTDSESAKVARKTSVEALASVVQPLLAALQGAEVDEAIVTEFEADESVRLLLEKLHFYVKRLRGSKRRDDGNSESSEDSAEN